MKLENILNLAAVAVIAAHLGKKAQEKKDIQALDSEPGMYRNVALLDN